MARKERIAEAYRTGTRRLGLHLLVGQNGLIPIVVEVVLGLSSCFQSFFIRASCAGLRAADDVCVSGRRS